MPRKPLIRRFLPPYLAISLLSVGVATFLRFQQIEPRLVTIADAWSLTVSQSLEHLLQAGQDLQLKRTISTLSLNPHMYLVAVATGNPPVVRYSSQHSYHNRPLASVLPADILPAMQRALATRQAQSSHWEYSGTLIHTYILPLTYAVSVFPPHDEQALIVIRTDLSVFDYHEELQFALETALTLIFVLVFSLLFYWLFRHYVLARLKALLSVVSAREKGNTSIRAPVEGEDEITLLSRHINQLMEHENADQQKLNAYAHEVEQQNFALATARDEAEQATRLKSEFLATMSHELRTPLHGILGFSQMLSSSTLPPQQAEYAQALHQSAESLLVLLNDILDLSKIEAGRLSLEQVPFNLRNLAQEVLQLVAPTAAQKGLELSFSYNAPELLVGDPLRLRQILLNLASNAVKFTQKGCVIIVVEGPVEPSRNPLPITLSVIDTGIGIPEDKQKLVFEKFTQAEGSTTRNFGGTGLGLAITKKLVEMMNGHIILHSRPGHGATFRVTVPLPLSPGVSGTGASHSAPVAVSPAHLSLCRVLLADDHSTNLMLATHSLEKIGVARVNIHTAVNGAKVLEFLRHNVVDVIFMDCQMPELDGFAATRAWRVIEAEQALVRTPIIALTANALSGTREQCLAAGMDDFVSKPFSLEVLKEVLLRHFKPPASAGSPAAP